MDGIDSIAHREGRMTTMGKIVIHGIYTTLCKTIIGTVAFDEHGVKFRVVLVERKAIDRVKEIKVGERERTICIQEIEQQTELLRILHGFLDVFDGLGRGDINTRLGLESKE